MDDLDILRNAALNAEYHDTQEVLDALIRAYEADEWNFTFHDKSILRAIGLNYRRRVDLVHKLVDYLQSGGPTRLGHALTLLSHPIDNSYADRCKKDEKALHEQHYEYIKCSQNQVSYTFREVSEAFPQEYRFIDVGCGDGEKLVLAHAYIKGIKEATGVEYTAHTYHLGLQALERAKFMESDPTYTHANGHTCELIHGDAFDLDYKDWNFIYLYCPICDLDRMYDLHTHIIRTMPVGGVMVEMLPHRIKTLIADFNMVQLLPPFYEWVVRRTEMGYFCN